MYSVVLMAALTAGAETPSWGWRHGCHGCWGGYGCCGCYGGNGCNGCCGGRGWYGCHGCYGGWYGWNGCSGGCYGSCYGIYSGGAVRPTAPPRGGYAEPIPAPAGDKPKEEKKKKETSRSTSAKLIVELPADAKLFIDNKPMESTGSKRVFATPRLEPGKKYYYVLRIEIMRDGEPLTDSKQVVFQAGDEIRASFAKAGPPAPTDKVAVESQ